MAPYSTFMLSAALSILLNLSVLAVFIVVIVTVVRRHRPDAVPPLLGAVIAELLIAVLSFVGSTVLSRVVGAAAYADYYAAQTAVFALAGAAARGLFLWGIVRLARPPEHAG